MDTKDSAQPWYAVHVQPRYERTVASILLMKGYESFLPLYRCRHRWSDRIKVIELPLFDGYLFCQFDVTKRLPILVTPRVIGIVGEGRIPVPIQENEMAALFAIVLAEAKAEPYPYLQVGQRVRVDGGPLSGLEGIILALSKPTRLIVSVTLLKRSVAVEIDETCLRPIEAAPHQPMLRAPYRAAQPSARQA
jgi:transcription antitermination factor NusG